MGFANLAISKTCYRQIVKLLVVYLGLESILRGEYQLNTEEKPYKEIGILIRNLRISKGMSQYDLARAINVNNSYLSRIENGERRPSTKIMRKMAEVFDFPYNELVIASGLLSPSFREKPTTAPESDLAEDIREIKSVLSRIVGIQLPYSVAPGQEIQRRAIPVFDTVPAGLFDEANVISVHDDIQKIILAEEELNYDPRAFALIVKGDSMVDAGILEGDVLIVSPSSKVSDGDIAVVQINRRETTVKVVYFEDNYLLLQAANSRYKPMILKYPDEVEILGKVILVRRKFLA